MNVRRFEYGIGYVNWVNIIGFLNLAVVGLDPFDVHQSVCLSDGESRRPSVLDTGPVAGAARHDPLEQILVCRDRDDRAVRGVGGLISDMILAAVDGDCPRAFVHLPRCSVRGCRESPWDWGPDCPI